MDFEQQGTQLRQDPYLHPIYFDLPIDPTSHPGFSIIQDQLFYKNKLVLPSSSPFVPIILREGHYNPMEGHSCILRTLKRIAASFYWVGMKANIKRFVTHSEVCQKNKSSNMEPTGLLQPLPIPDNIWEDISMDFIKGQPLSEGIDSILVVIDCFSKFGHFIRLHHPFSAKSVASVFICEIVRLHGFP